ncbi:MAG TPA: ATP-binding protein [Cyclobacteriaceae bacterium]|jgi:signal transduction histidine kinase|nr:ATP-binding protein [Cyclobacteriaceae bacterium]
MPIKTFLRGYVLASVVILIGVLLLVNIFLIYENSRIIEKNKIRQEEAELVKVTTVDITRNLHLLDMAIRSYALVTKPRFFQTMDSAAADRSRIFKRLETALISQQAPMDEFYALRDSIIVYFDVVSQMRAYLLNNQRDKFLSILDEDPGYIVFSQQQQFAINIRKFEDKITADAKIQYERALRDSYLLQVILFFLTMPTLAYSAYYASHSLRTSEKLRRAEELNNDILSRQNARLEQLVKERTHEILAQNEEITSQNEEIVSHNEQLVAQQTEIENQRNVLARQNENLKNAKETIENQSAIIQQKNDELLIEVKRQTQDLKTTNLELIEQNNRLEQFAYIISHNLRAPMARIIGLAQVFEYAKDQEEIRDIINMMVNSTTDLDKVIKDLAQILELQKLNTQVLVITRLEDVIAKTIRTLKREIEETKTNISIQLDNETTIHTLPQYIESIFYNLISNAIKYRRPDVEPTIIISSRTDDKFIRVEISDNGLGIDLEKFGDKLFLLYKRFHFHVEGKGMGLYLVKSQMSALGGNITVESKIDEGTTFVLFFKK